MEERLPWGMLPDLFCDELNDPLPAPPDVVRVVDPTTGLALREFSVMESMVRSWYVPRLQQTSNICDPLHLNYVDMLGSDANDIDGLAHGDLVISLRNLSAFAIMDSDTGDIKQLIQGGFIQQHSVRHWEGSKFLMFDNQGAFKDGYSRLLMVDISTGKEVTIFPNERTPISIKERAFQMRVGNVDISDDGERAIVSYTGQGFAVEVRLQDGEILTVFEFLHDLSSRGDLYGEMAEERPSVTNGPGILYRNQ